MESSRLATPIQRHLCLVWLVVLLGMLASVVAAIDESSTKLPRMEVQFLCNRNLLEEGFNALKVFQDFYHDEIFSKDDQDLPTIDFNAASMSSSTNATNSSQPLPPTNNTTPPKKQPPYELDLFVAVGINTAADVNFREWYYSRCDRESNETLVTVDVRGYYKSLGEEEAAPSWEWNDPTDPSTSYDAAFGKIESYLSSKVCQGQPLDFFRTYVNSWDDDKYPIPEYSDYSEPELSAKGGGHATFPTTSILERDGYKELSYYGNKDYYYRRYQKVASNQGYYYDHDLYIVCEGTHLDADPVQMPSTPFLVAGILCGYLMIAMIKTELTRPLRYRQLPPRNRVQGPIDERNNNNNNNNASNDASNDTSSNNTNTSTNDTFEDEHNDDREDTRRQRQEIEMTAWML